MRALIRRCRYQVEAWLVLVAASLVPRLSRRQVLALGRFGGCVAYLIDYRGRRTGRENLRVVFPDRSCDWRDAVLVRSYQSIAGTALDLFWSLNLDACSARALLRVEWDDPRTHAAAAATGALWCTPHYGNFEWVALAMPWQGLPMTLVAQHFKNPALTPIFTRLRSRNGNTVIPPERAMLRLLKNLNRTGHSAFLCDLTVKPDRAATIIRCFGLKMSTTILHAALSRRSGLPVVPTISIPHPDGTCTMRHFPAQHYRLDQPLHEIAQHIWDLLEPVIRAAPEHWLWMYKHWRYLPADTEGRDYPAYANRSKTFDALDRAESTAARTGVGHR